MLFVVSEEGAPSEAKIVHLDVREHVRASHEGDAEQNG
jgi:hypothetical protein